MENHHWTEEQFVERIYGIGLEDGHLEKCALCKRKWDEYAGRREAYLSGRPIIPYGDLAQQRHAIRKRLAAGRRNFRLHILSPLATALLVLVIITVLRPVRKSGTVESPSDAELYREVFTMVSSTTPTAVEPLQSLFEVNP